MAAVETGYIDRAHMGALSAPVVENFGGGRGRERGGGMRMKVASRWNLTRQDDEFPEQTKRDVDDDDDDDDDAFGVHVIPYDWPGCGHPRGGAKEMHGDRRRGMGETAAETTQPACPSTVPCPLSVCLSATAAGPVLA